MTVATGSYMLAMIGFCVLLSTDLLHPLPGQPGYIWYFFRIGLGTTAIIICAIYCWVRPNLIDD